MKALNKLAQRIHKNAKDHGFYDYPETPDQFVARALANLHAEISEFWEAHRNGTLDKPCDKAEQMKAKGLKPLTSREEELADIIIRALDNAAFWGVDIGLAVEMKHRYNVMRPYQHGGKKA